jgi:hypothetical protein
MTGDDNLSVSSYRFLSRCNISKIGTPSPYILISKISKLSNKTINDMPLLADKVLSKRRASVDEVKDRFFNKLHKLDYDQLSKIYDMMDINILKTIRIVEGYPVTELIKKGVLPRKNYR